MECRRVVNPVSQCQLIFQWEPILNLNCSEPSINLEAQGVTASESDAKVNCNFQSWTGIGPYETKHQNVTNTIKSYASIGAHNDDIHVKWTVLKKLLRPDIKKWFAMKFPQRPQLLEKFMSDQLWKKHTTIGGNITYSYKSPLIPNNLFKKIRPQINLKHEPVLEQLVGVCNTYRVLFDLVQTKNHVYFEQSIRKRLTRIVFELEF